MGQASSHFLDLKGNMAWGLWSCASVFILSRQHRHVSARVNNPYPYPHTPLHPTPFQPTKSQSVCHKERASLQRVHTPTHTHYRSYVQIPGLHRDSLCWCPSTFTGEVKTNLPLSLNLGWKTWLWEIHNHDMKMNLLCVCWHFKFKNHAIIWVLYQSEPSYVNDKSQTTLSVTNLWRNMNKMEQVILCLPKTKYDKHRNTI